MGLRSRQGTADSGLLSVLRVSWGCLGRYILGFFEERHFKTDSLEN